MGVSDNRSIWHTDMQTSRVHSRHKIKPKPFVLFIYISSTEYKGVTNIEFL